MKTLFEDGDLTTKLPGTRVMAAWLNKVFAHRHDGLNQDGSAPLDFSEDTGAANTIVTALNPPLAALVAGLPICIRAAHANTGPVTVNIDGLGGHGLQKLGGLALDAGDIQATQIIQVAWDGANFQLLNYNSPPVTDAATLQGQGRAMLAPPGMLAYFGMPTVPSGWLPCDGRTVLRAQYSELFAAIGTTWGAGDNVSTFSLPELRGEFFRAWDNGRGVDADRQFGSWQQDELQNITGEFRADDRSAVGSGAIQVGVTADVGSEGSGVGYVMTFDASRVARTGTETRPRNVAVLSCIKY